MKIARPPGGFKISMTANVKALIDQQCAASAEFAQHWKDITDRLRFTAHVEGVADSRFEAGCRLWAAAEDAERNLPRVKLLYQVVGNVIRIKIAAIG